MVKREKLSSLPMANKKPMRLVGVRVPQSLYNRLMMRVNKTKRETSGATVNLASVVRALLEEHA